MKYGKTKAKSRNNVDVAEGLKEAIREVKLIKQCKLKGIPARDLLNDL